VLSDNRCAWTLSIGGSCRCLNWWRYAVLCL